MSTYIQTFSRFVVWSNLFYLIPLALSLYTHFYIDSLVLAVLIVCSTAFHATREKRFVRADLAASIAVIAVNAVACALAGFKTPYFTLVWTLAVLAFIIRYYVERGDRGGIAHGFWHALAAIILSLCVFVYTS